MEQERGKELPEKLCAKAGDKITDCVQERNSFPLSQLKDCHHQTTSALACPSLEQHGDPCLQLRSYG